MLRPARSLFAMACAALLAAGCLEVKPAAPKEVMGYALTGHVTSVDLNADVDRGLLTTVCIHAAYPDAMGKLTGFTPTSPSVKAFVDKCHGKGAAVVLSVASFSSTTIKAVLDAHQDALVASIHDAVAAAGLDGASIDLEEVPDTTTYRDKFAAFCEKVALSMHAESKKMYVAVHPIVYLRYDGAKLAAVSDGLFLMGYGYHWSGSKTTGPLAPLTTGGFWSTAYENKIFSTTVANSWSKVVTDPKKLILGTPWYGYRWPTSSTAPGAATLAKGTALSYRYDIAGKYTKIWDEKGKVPYAAYTKDGSTYQLWYDDEESLGLKFDAAKDHAFGGIGCWRLPWGNDAVWGKGKAYKDGIVLPPLPPLP